MSVPAHGPQALGASGPGTPSKQEEEPQGDSWWGGQRIMIYREKADYSLGAGGGASSTSGLPPEPGATWGPGPFKGKDISGGVPQMKGPIEVGMPGCSTVQSSSA